MTWKLLLFFGLAMTSVGIASIFIAIALSDIVATITRFQGLLDEDKEHSTAL